MHFIAENKCLFRQPIPVKVQILVGACWPDSKTLETADHVYLYISTPKNEMESDGMLELSRIAVVVGLQAVGLFYWLLPFILVRSLAKCVNRKRSCGIILISSQNCARPGMCGAVIWRPNGASCLCTAFIYSISTRCRLSYPVRNLSPLSYFSAT